MLLKAPPRREEAWRINSSLPAGRHGSSFSPLCDSLGRVWSRLGASASFVKRKAALRIIAAFSHQLLTAARRYRDCVGSRSSHAGRPLQDAERPRRDHIAWCGLEISGGAVGRHHARIGRSASRTGRVHRSKDTRGHPWGGRSRASPAARCEVWRSPSSRRSNKVRRFADANPEST